MERLIEKQMANIEKAYESIPMGGKLEFSKSAIEGIYQVLKELKEYKDLEEQNLLLVLPCKNGTEIFVITDKDFMDFEKVIETRYYLNGVTEYTYGQFGIDWFLIREQAEQKLKELQEGEK